MGQRQVLVRHVELLRSNPVAMWVHVAKFAIEAVHVSAVEFVAEAAAAVAAVHAVPTPPSHTRLEDELLLWK